MASRREQAGLPKGAEMRALVLDCLRHMVNPVNRKQIGDAVAQRLGLSPEQLAVREPASGGGDSSRPFVDWWCEWACNDLKHIGVTEQPGRGLYQLTQEGRAISLNDVEQRNRERHRRYREQRQRTRRAKVQEPSDAIDSDDSEVAGDWQSQLLDRLMNASPTAFEHLAGALLQAAGFDDVEVTGRGGDGGIDGIGTYRPSGLISFHTAFQCKRYKGSVGSSTVRDFRGSFIGRSDRGIIITTGSFTRDARDEAARPGANPVDLIDGEALCELLKEHSLGVRTTLRTVEDVAIDDSYFDQFEDSR
ncbi:MAG: restriction endonuclease [Chloroflexi bacterium]|nr:restriction endonuclease [Chloroflexota bacterium]MCY3589570.1 restriction endonuclease [Chloroflexota bacterium]MCY3685858.1 restriction endonuclease [Chloroflexota bacterium]MDE2709626.1 restriction endonuclease [Chloroflexota bacterium]